MVTGVSAIAKLDTCPAPGLLGALHAGRMEPTGWLGDRAAFQMPEEDGPLPQEASHPQAPNPEGDVCPLVSG